MKLEWTRTVVPDRLHSDMALMLGKRVRVTVEILEDGE